MLSGNSFRLNLSYKYNLSDRCTPPLNTDHQTSLKKSTVFSKEEVNVELGTSVEVKAGDKISLIDIDIDIDIDSSI